MGEGHDGFAVGDLGEVLLLLLLCAGVANSHSGHDDGVEVGARDQGPAELLDEDHEVEELESCATVILREGQAHESLFYELLPQLGRVAFVIFFHVPHEGLGTLGFEHLPCGPFEHFLFFAKAQVHLASSLPVMDVSVSVSPSP